MNAPIKLTAAEVAADPVAALGTWFLLKARAAALVEEERALRALLFAHFFPGAVEGTNNFTLPDGHVLKGKLPYDRKVDPAVVVQLRALRIVDLEPALAASLNLSGNPPEQLVTEALSLNVDSLLNWKPELSVKPYRQLTAEQSAIFDRCLTVKPGSISMEVADPPKAAATPGAQGFK